MSDTGYVLVDGGPEPITDIKILSKKENRVTDYEVVSKFLDFRGGRGLYHQLDNERNTCMYRNTYRLYLSIMYSPEWVMLVILSGIVSDLRLNIRISFVVGKHLP